MIGTERAYADLKRAFSAPKICTVLAGYFARLTRDPAPDTTRYELCALHPLSSPRITTSACMHDINPQQAASCLRCIHTLSTVARQVFWGATCMRDEAGAHGLADERAQIGRDGVHLVQEVGVQL